MKKKRTLEIIKKYASERPKADRNLDQFWATEETVIKRAELLGKIDGISNKKIIFLGDDDLTSIYFILSYQAKEVMVIDIDKRLIDYIQKISVENVLGIKTAHLDLRQPLPKNINDFDIVFFDPAYTPQAVNVWLRSSIEATLGKGSNKKRKSPDFLIPKRYYMCYGYTDRSSERGLKIQEIITKYGLIIQEKIRKFNRYLRAKSINSTSDLYILMPTPKVNIKKIDANRSNFYTGRKQK